MRTHLGRLVKVVAADGNVVPDLAKVLRPARRVGQAWVDAEVVNAGLVVGAVVVVETLTLSLRVLPIIRARSDQLS